MGRAGPIGAHKMTGGGMAVAEVTVVRAIFLSGKGALRGSCCARQGKYAVGAGSKGDRGVGNPGNLRPCLLTILENSIHLMG